MGTQNFRVKVGGASAIVGVLLALGSVVAGGSASATSGSAVSAGSQISSHNSVNATSWSTSEGCPGEWHWVITGLEGSGIGADDVPAVVHVTWSDDSSTDVTFEKLVGGVAHYLDTEMNVPPVLTVKSATAVWPDPTDVDSYNNFNLSHGPCVPVPTTTTVPEETTTVPEETTTVPEETTTIPDESTTTIPDESTTSVPAETTTSVESEVPTTAGETTTTEKVESQSPGGILPSTGGTILMLAGGLVMLGGGVLAAALGRRRRMA